MKVCSAEGCHRPVLGRGLCAPHYSYWHRAQRKYDITCGYCGKQTQVSRKGAKYCSRICGSRAGLKYATPARAAQQKRDALKFRQCEWCNALHTDARKFCSQDCRTQASEHHALGQRGPMRVAIENRDYPALLVEIKNRCQVDESGCWLWTGATVQSRKGGSYPTYKTGNSQWQVHRLALEAKLGAPLGSQTAHHTCARPQCVNPEHLQQATARDNVAEMLARTDYVRRIIALEAALSELHADHPLLLEAPLAGVLRAA